MDQCILDLYFPLTSHSIFSIDFHPNHLQYTVYFIKCNYKFCFLSQILGFDILLTKNLKPVLLEVNSNPSMRIEHEQEVRVNVNISVIVVLSSLSFTLLK